MRKFKVLVLAGMLAFVSIPAAAQEGETAGEAPPAEAAPAAGPADPTTYDFEDDLVQGDLVRPDGELLNVRRRGRRSTLIQIRTHFIPEMLKSVEDL